MQMVLMYLLLKFLLGYAATSIINTDYQEQWDKSLYALEEYFLKFNQYNAEASWNLTVRGALSHDEAVKATTLMLSRSEWKNQICEGGIEFKSLRADQKRKLYLFCRGPKYDQETIIEEARVLNDMKVCYQIKLCFDKKSKTPLIQLALPGQNTSTYPKPGDCVMGEPDLDNLMKRTDLNPEQLKWTWLTWHNTVGKSIREVFPKVVDIQNSAAKERGYSNMGEVWRDELEVRDLQKVAIDLYVEIEPLYQLMHSALRHKLLLKYGTTKIDPTGPIPIHLTGNMWAQNWSPMIELFDPMRVSLEERIGKKNWTVHDMLIRAEDFYTSMGLPKMTEKFWKNSIFEDASGTNVCHGTAANMYTGDDFRMIICAKRCMYDFYVMHHEMGHLEYNMAYANQTSLFQEGANSAFHEAIGDTIMHGVMVPQHLYRLGLLNDDDLLDPEIDENLLLEHALGKIPEIPFALIIDLYRWKIFDGSIKLDNYNMEYWKLNRIIRGIDPPERRSEDYMDAGGKFHVPDNTPFIRYFLSSIIQMQIFKGLCELSLFGKHNVDPIDATIEIPLHKCDIYGCKICGKKLKEAMSLGASKHWSVPLQILTGQKQLSTAPLLEYYAPIHKMLQNYVDRHRLPVGWSI